jgi:hypothetical protein
MAVIFNGSSGYFNAGNVYNLPNGSATSTIMTWVRRAAVGARHDLISKEQSGATGYELSVLSSNLPEWGIFDGSNYRVVAGTTTLSINTTYHLCGTYDGTSLKVYVNGVLEKTGNYSTGSTNSYNLNFGRRPAASNYLNGQLEDIRMYNRALSIDEINTVYYAKGTDNIVNGLILSLPLSCGGAPGTTPGTQIDRTDTKLSISASGTLTWAENIAINKPL